MALLGGFLVCSSIMDYYNDNDPKVGAWLAEVIRRGLLPEGKVDVRSIADLRADDVAGFRQCHFFAGIGGWPLALRMAGWPDHLRVWTGSCPCQPFSQAGEGRGTDDERHLWPAFRDLIALGRPPAIFGEQVASKLGREWLAGVRTDLEALGYAVGCADLCAASVGSPHIRQRLFWGAVNLDGARGISDASRDGRRGGVGGVEGGSGLGWSGSPDDGTGNPLGLEEPRGVGVSSRLPGSNQGNEGGSDQPHHSGSVGLPWSEYVVVQCLDGKARRIEPGLAPVAHGLPARVVRLRGYGNAILPHVAAAFVESFIEAVRS